jgi:hypothetical protein
MLTPRAILMLLGFVCLILAALDVQPQRVKLEPLGLALWLLAVLVSAG